MPQIIRVRPSGSKVMSSVSGSTDGPQMCSESVAISQEVWLHETVQNGSRAGFWADMQMRTDQDIAKAKRNKTYKTYKPLASSEIARNLC